MVWCSYLLAAVTCGGSASPAAPEPGVHGHYLVLSAISKSPPPFEVVDLVYGPRETIDGRPCVWWELSARAKDDGDEPLFRLRVLSSRDPLAESADRMQVEQYILRIPETKETLAYRNIHTGKPLLPPWKDWPHYFFPRRARASGSQLGLANSAEYLGHVLTLRHTARNAEWPAWEQVKTLNLDPELLIGTSREFKDKEGHRLPQEPERQNYTYIPFTGEDYRAMIDAGSNLFPLSAKNEEHVRSEPVFYLRSAAGDPKLRYPADLYRGNYVGAVMFMDEPTSILTGDENVNRTLKYWSDFAALIRARVHAQYNNRYHYGAYHLDDALRGRGVNLGDMRLMQYDYPSWETVLETTYYQMAGGCNGLVHEGRYQLSEFTEGMDRWTGTRREYTPEEYLRCQFAMLRGGTRPFNKYWGTSIYGQCDPKLAPLAMTLAYDMGARYVWFWSSDHDHHMPWPEQIELTRHLRAHVQKHPRGSISGPPPTRDLAIALPYGYFMTLGHGADNPHSNLWWMRELDVKEHKNESSLKYARVMQRACKAVLEAINSKLDYDITVDDGRDIVGYKRVLKISDQE